MKYDLKFDFMKNRKYFIAISAIVILIGIVFNFINGTELDIQFKGGSMISYSYDGEEMNQDEIQKAVEELLGQDVEIQLSRYITSATDNQDPSETSDDTTNQEKKEQVKNKIVITLADNNAITLEQQKDITQLLKEKHPNQNIEFLTNNIVPPNMGKEFLLKCLVALALAAVSLILYVGFRFRNIGGFSAGTMAILALLHDVTIAYFTFVILGFPIDDNFVAVALAILGFSINDTIIIYDRIRENKRIMGPKASITEITNISINQTLGRTLNTSLCTIIAMGTICVVAAMKGLTSIYSFAFPMMAGLISGAFTSICLVGPIWVLWADRENKSSANK